MKNQKQKMLPSMIEVRGNIYSLRELDLTSLKAHNKYDSLILEARMDDKTFLDATENDRKVFCDSVLLTGTALVGCKLPETDFFADYLSREISFYLESLAIHSVSLSEILLAMRLNSVSDIRYSSGDYCKPIAFSGSYFNVSFFASVMDRYMAVRNSLNGKIYQSFE